VDHEYRNRQNLMAEMKLLGMLAAFDKALSDATRDQSSHSELVDTLLQAECDYRQERKTGSRIKAAQVHPAPGVRDIDFTASRSISRRRSRALQSAVAARRQTVLLIAQPRRQTFSPRPRDCMPVRAANRC